MVARRIGAIAAMTLTCALLPPAAQAGGETAGQTTPVDAALLAKANAGDAAAQVAVGESYIQAAPTAHNRVRISSDYQQAAAWYKKAADQNNIGGELHLAALYRDGAGKAFPRDPAQAAALYRKAANQGDAGAQGTLGMLYTLGLGVPQSDVEAYFWLDLAASVKGPNQARYAANRQNVGTRITVDELQDVQDRVVAWQAAHPRPGATR